MKRRGWLWWGVAVAAVYIVACVATMATGTHPLRPLYEGIGPAAPYRWVDPPPQFKAANLTPAQSREAIDLTPSGSPQIGGETGDGQFVLTLPAGAVPASTTESGIVLSIIPFDPARLAAVPDGLHPDGNAYEVTMSYAPSGQPIRVSDHPIDAIIETPVPSVALFTSPDGQTWTRIVDQHIPGRAAIYATFTDFGYFLTAYGVPPVAQPVAPVVTRPASHSSKALLVIIVVLVALIPAVVAVWWRIRQRRAPDEFDNSPT